MLKLINFVSNILQIMCMVLSKIALKSTFVY